MTGDFSGRASRSASDIGKSPAPKYFHNSSHPDGKCGWGPTCSPSWLQYLRWPPIVVFYIWFACVPVFSNGAYFGAILPAIERQFGLSSSQSALLASLSKLSSTVSVLCVTFLAERTNRAFVFASCFVMTAIGNFLTALPHFLSEPLDAESLLSGQRYTGSSAISSLTPTICHISDTFGEQNSTINTTCEEEPVGFHGLIWWAVVGQIVLGAGHAGVYPIALPLMDDLAGRYRRRFVVYFTCFSTVLICGQAFGYLLAIFALEQYVDFERIPANDIPVGLSKSDPRWIGAWWIGFLVSAVYQLLAAIPLTLLPKDPSVNVRVGDGLADTNKNECETDMDKNSKFQSNRGIVIKNDSNRACGDSVIEVKDNLWENIKGIIPIFKRILCRPVLIFYMLFVTTEVACVGVLNAFAVKYFKLQFSISGKHASLLNGAVLIPAAILGLNTSGYISRRFRLTLKQCAVYMLCNNIVTIVLLIIASFIGCKNQPVAGVTKEYATSLDGVVCNMNCGCNSNIFRPVCGADSVSYLSPCNAGCHVQDPVNNTHLSTYSNCTCIQAPSSAEFEDGSDFGNAKSGLCDQDDRCETNLYITVFMIGLLTFCRFQDNALSSLIMLGNCETEIRTTMLGLTNFVYNIIGFFPTPIYFGAIVNTTCILWQYTCGERGACWLYDIVKLRYSIFGLNIGLRFLQALICTGIVLTVKEGLTKNTNGDIHKKNDNEELVKHLKMESPE